MCFLRGPDVADVAFRVFGFAFADARRCANAYMSRTTSRPTPMREG
jgi:hypothetical protein